MNVVACMWRRVADHRVNMYVDGVHDEGTLEQMETKQQYTIKILQ